MRVTAKVDYAVRAATELAAANGDGLVKAEAIANAQDIPRKFLDNILQGLRQAGIVESRRGPEGGHRLAQPASEITIADVIRAVEGPLASVRGEAPETVKYGGAAEALGKLWVAVRANLRAVLEHTTLADVTSGKLPKTVKQLAASPDAWEHR